MGLQSFVEHPRSPKSASNNRFLGYKMQAFSHRGAQAIEFQPTVGNPVCNP
jgi:hypothetical protein